MNTRNKKGKTQLKRKVSQWMAVTLTAAAVLSAAPVTGYATPVGGEVNFVPLTVPDTAPPVFVGAVSSNGKYVYLKFNEYFSIHAPDNSTPEQVADFLKNNISLSSDGVNFTPFQKQDSEAYIEDQELYLSYNQNMKIITSANTVIKIAAGTIKDEVGNLNEEMNLQVSPPVIQSAEVSSDNHDIVITFNEEVFDNTEDEGFLKEYIEISRNPQKNSIQLTEQDTATVVSGKLHIHLVEAIKGESNQIIISGRALRDAEGNVQNDTRATAYIKANTGVNDPNPADTTPPKLERYFFSNELHDLALYFDEDIQMDEAAIATFKQNVQMYNNATGYYNGLANDVQVTISGNTINLHFVTLPPGDYSYFYFYGLDVITDMNGNKLSDNGFETRWTNKNQLSNMYSYNNYLSYNGRLLSLGFESYSNSLVDLTVDGTGSHLKEKIQISLDQGNTFEKLGPNDIVSLQNNEIKIIFHNAITVGSIQLKVEDGIVGDEYGYRKNIEVNTRITDNTPDFRGSILSNAVSEFLFEDNTSWRDQVTSIEVYDNYQDITRELTSSEYTLTNGKLTIQKGVFLDGREYYINIKANGYSSKRVEGYAMKSTELFYMTAPAVTPVNGITAKINVLARNNNNQSGNDYLLARDSNSNTNQSGNQSVVFQLFNGTTPVSIVAADLKVGTGTYSANFNVSDAATNPNYTVKAYIVSKYSDDPTDVGLNLASVKTQSEFDQALLLSENNNNNNPS
ncbi:hemoblobin-interacting domain-containing protein [Paenibacillus sinopodophylli]|uniref:hemoblobin-interacting domain-containing protein n=1 Tax=Paenibacillus sinopodophylli TaxID=1837342 RepID=UPI00110D0DE8|nr:hemoblobin-interacting domain-containing protein [Paenibacillus sinopodophylli]